MRVTRWGRPACMVLLAVVTVVGAGGCGMNLLSTQEEIALGARVAAQVEQKAELYEDWETNQYISELGARIARVSDRQDVVYRYKVVKDHNTVNAFAVPGGWVYLYTGLLRLAESEAELVGVIAHETAHVAAKHSAKQISAKIGTSLLLSVALGQSPGLAAEIGTQLLSGVGFARMSQADEHEADERGIKYMKRAGYDPAAMASFLRKLDAQHKRRPGTMSQLFASHPLTPARIGRAEDLATTVGRGGRVGADTYRRRLARLLAEPAPPKKGDKPGSPPPTLPTSPAPARPDSTAGVRPQPVAAPMTSRREDRPMLCRNLTKGKLVATRLEMATTSATRRKGLLGRSGLPPGGGLLLVPCSSVHTLRMKFAIDIVFLDKKMRVKKIVHNVKPGAPMISCVGARSVLELPSGTAAAKRIEIGDQLAVQPAPEPKKGDAT